MPDLRNVDTVPVGWTGRSLEEVVYGSAGRTVVDGGRIPEAFDIVTLFDVGDEAELLDDLLRSVMRDGNLGFTAATARRID